MAIFNEVDLRSKSINTRSGIYKSASQILSNSVTTAAIEQKTFDVFLSHSFQDADLIYGIKLSLEEIGHSVYVDWIEDKDLSRDIVTKETAQVIKTRILQCRSLFFATTENASSSKWMPWELGYMDGAKSKSAILPITKSRTTSNSYKGQEYLGIYPYVVKDKDRQQVDRLWVHKSDTDYEPFSAWLLK